MRCIQQIVWCVGMVLLCANELTAQQLTDPDSQAEELGSIAWWRDYDHAMELSKASGKPVLILFQEIPGCSTCKNYGSHVLSNEVLVRAVEEAFIPLAIYNNRKGVDAEILAKYGEPAWNNPVVRIVDAAGKDRVPRLSGNNSVEGLATSMFNALAQSKRAVPEALQLLYLEQVLGE